MKSLRDCSAPRSEPSKRGACAAALLCAQLLGCTAVIDGQAPERTAAATPDATQSGGGTTSVSSPERRISATPLRRLNRLEYDRTVRDLLGVDLKPSAAFPVDGAIGGFDNIAEGLALPPSLLDLYLSAARELTNAALDAKPTYSASIAPESGAPTGYSVGTTAWALHGATWRVSAEVPTTASYRVSIELSGMATGNAPQPTCDYSIDGQLVGGSVALGVPTKPATTERELSLTAGAHRIEVVPTNFTNIGVENTNNEVIVHSFKIESVEKLPPVAGERVFVCDPAQAGCPERIVTSFASKAFRRPLTTSEQAQLTELYTKLAGAEGRDEALKLALRAVLTSPKFLYRAVRRSDWKSPEQLDDFVVASRLSYFLWSTTPDVQLLDAAASGQLSSDDGIRGAVARMLNDPKVDGLSDGFAEQWLAVRGLRSAAPSPAVYPSFDEALRSAMVQESKLFFADFLDNGLPVRALSNPSFGYLNDRLALHYGLPAPGSDEVKRVSLEGNARRGILELGAWLTAQSEPEHTSPIRRGRWFLEQLLCTPISPPPAGVAAVLPADPTLTVRERLARHRSAPVCAGCHNLLDPAGLGFEAYDGIGAFRASENGKPIDTSGALPTGETFANVRELGELLTRSSLLSACLAQKLLMYGLGRPQNQDDQPFLDDVLQAAHNGDGTIPDLLTALATSPLFRAPPSHPDFEQTP